MPEKIVRSTEDFGKLISENGYYVDKTEMIYELVQETGNDVTLFTRPRRFGKTLTMSMLENFFSNRKDSREIFNSLAIAKNHPEFCEKWMNRYPALFISLKDVEGLSFEEALNVLRTAIAEVCKTLSDIDDKQDTDDLARFARLKAETATIADLKYSLKTLMRMMNTAYGRQVVLLIDEYDVPLAKAHTNGYYKQMLDVIRGLMSTSLKTNEYLKFAVVTGCLRIPKESIFTGVNNFAAYSVLDVEFSQYFGFTPDEVENLLKYYDREEKIQITASWYDGYSFAGTEVYCPWDVMSYVSALRKKSTANPKPYWENTSGNDAFKAFFELGTDDIADKFETLLNGGSIMETVTNALTYNEVYDSESNLWSVLLMTGYLTAEGQGGQDADEEDDESTVMVKLRIPNREISKIFQRAVVDHFNKTVDRDRIDELIAALWEGDAGKASSIMSDLLFETIRFMDYHEDYYHAFVAGIFKGRGYAPKSNREHGLGRSDVNLRDRRNRRAMIIETKVAESMKELDKACDEGIKQIVDLQYARDTDGYKLVRCYGLAFFKKTAKFKLMK